MNNDCLIETEKEKHTISNKTHVNVTISTISNGIDIDMLFRDVTTKINSDGEMIMNIYGIGVPNDIRSYKIESDALMGLPIKIEIIRNSTRFIEFKAKIAYFVDVKNADLFDANIDIIENNEIIASKKSEIKLELNYHSKLIDYSLHYSLTESTKTIIGYSDVILRNLFNSTLPTNIIYNKDVHDFIDGKDVYFSIDKMDFLIFLTGNEYYKSIEFVERK